jgi:signal transduction histidine kinase
LAPAGHLEKLQAAIPEAQGSILLKPVTRVVLRAFLASAAAGERSSEIGTLQANRDEMLQHLLHANLRLQEYDQQRTNFIARALHDFRAPLTALSGFCGLLIGEELGPMSEVQRGVLRRMQRSTERISTMASAMFELSTAPGTGRNTDLRQADILDTILQAVHEIGPQARAKHIEVRTDRISAPPQALYFEASQIEQVLINLLDNACKFTPKFGYIEIAGYPYSWEPPAKRGKQARKVNAYRIDVKDNGPGVSEDIVEHIFEEYTSYSGPQDRSGGGLGLAICRLILSRHQGHVWAEAGAEGGVFSMVLPLRPQGHVLDRDVEG